MMPRSLLLLSLLVAVVVALAFRGIPGTVDAVEGEGLAPVDPAASMAPIAPLAAPDSVVWRRPPGPVRVALQAGHWMASEAPAEQARLRTNGTRGGGKEEWEVNLEIARRAAVLLEAAGYEVDLLPTTIPPGYRADLFIAIHADGHPSASTSGYRAAAPRRDATGRAAEFVDILERTYGEATGLRHYPTVTRRMTGYYAFNWRRYTHALHPMTTAVILETGFLTSPGDRRVIVEAPDLAARGIADAVRLHLEQVDLEAEIVVPATLLGTISTL
jgi:hypothetical protein